MAGLGEIGKSGIQQYMFNILLLGMISYIALQILANTNVGNNANFAKNKIMVKRKVLQNANFGKTTILAKH